MSDNKIRTIEGHSFTLQDQRYARVWADSDGWAVPVRGKLSDALLLMWQEAGRPIVGDATTRPNVVATVSFRRLDKKGRPNGPVRTQEVMRDALERIRQGQKGRPRTLDYVTASGLSDDVRVSQVVTTQGAVHMVHVDDETGQYVARWTSKSDSLAVRVALLEAGSK